MEPDQVQAQQGLEGLRAALNARLAASPAAPADPGTTPAPAVVQPASPPAPAAQPEPASAGTTPTPAPGTEQTPDTLAFAAKLANADPSDPELPAKLAQRLVEYNQRLAEQARLAKAGAPAPSTPAAPGVPPAQPATAPQAAPNQPPATPTEPPRAATEATEQADAVPDVDATVDAWAQRVDPECISLARSFDEARTVATTVSQELSNLASDAAVLRSALDDAKRQGLGLPPLDEYAADEAKKRLAAIELEVRTKQFDLREARQAAKDAQEAYRQRKAGAKAALIEKRASEARAREQQQASEADARQYVQVWQATISDVLEANKVRPDDRAEAYAYALDKARLEGGPGLAEMRPFLDGKVKEWLSIVDRHHRSRAGDYATQKLADAAAASAPAIQGIVTPPKPPSSGDFERNLRAQMRRVRV